MNVLLSMVCLGGYTLLAQMLVTRELAGVCLGNELTIGIVFSVWLMLMGAGAWGVPLFRIKSVLAGPIFLWLAFVLPLVMAALRFEAGWIRPPGEYVALSKIFLASFLALAPICVPAGMVFPLGCAALLSRGSERPVSGVYAVEALGSFLAGVVFSFGLIGYFNFVQITFLASAIAIIGAAYMAESQAARRILHLLALGSLIIGAIPGVGEALEWQSVRWRWDSLGVTHDGRDGRPEVRLIAGQDTRFQNLVLTESAGQFSIYGDGEFMFSFPDSIACERAVNFVMAQKPEARRILVLGGNPVGELPFLLRYPVQEVVWVERDRALGDLIRQATPGLYEALVQEPRLTRVCEDGPRYVKQCRGRFDIVLIHAPQPVTGGLNRFYTREFYQDVSGVLAPGGFLHASLEASERLGIDAARMAGSVYRTLQGVYPVVKVTATAPLQFFASCSDDSLSLDRQRLYQRSADAPVERSTFRPEYFLDAEEIDPGKIAFTEQRLARWAAPENTLSRPISYYYTLILWSQYSHSTLDALFRRMALWQPGWVLGGVGGFGIVMAVAALVVRQRRIQPLMEVAPNLVMAITGFGGVALELILLYAFQGIHGYVYSRMGLMVGLFMLGAVLGASGARWLESASRDVVWRVVVLCLMMMIIVTGGVLWALLQGRGSEWLLYCLTLGVGTGVALQFIAVNRLAVLTGAAAGAASGRIWFADYWGSALGGLLVGVFLMPLLGLGVTCYLLMITFGGSILLFVILTPRLRE